MTELEGTQKKLDVVRGVAEKAVLVNANLRLKIIKANKILDEFPTKTYVMTDKVELIMPFQPIDEIAIWLERLREALK